MIAFDWDGTAVESRAQQPQELAQAMQGLLAAGVVLAVITGTNADNVSNQIASLLTASARSRLFLLVNRGSEVYAHTDAGERELLWRRDATPEELTALDAVADAVAAELAEHGVEIEIVRNRLNRRKLDVIPEPEWADPPKSKIGELLQAVNARLAGYPGGLGAIIDLTAAKCAELGLPDARITTDVKHVEVGLTDKSDSIAFIMRRLAPGRGIRPNEILIAGDEFGQIAGFEGSDYRMVTRLAAGAAIVSVGPEPNGTPPGVVHLGGGPAEFVRLLGEELERPDSRPERAPEVRPAAALTPAAGDGWVVQEAGYEPGEEASRESRFAVGNGYLGIRGSVDEGGPGSSPGMFVAGLYDGPEAGREDMVVAPDPVTVAVELGGVALEPWRFAEPSDRRTLELGALALRRELRITDPGGRRWLLSSRRFASLARPHVACFRLELTLEHGDACRVGVVAGLHAPHPGEPLPRVEVVAAGEHEGVDLLHTRTPGALVAVDTAQALAASLDGAGLGAAREVAPGFSGRRVEALVEPGSTLRIDRAISLHTERERPLPAPEAAREAAEAGGLGFDALLTEHEAAWAALWERAGIEVEGDHEAQLGVRFAVAQLAAAAPRDGARASIGAKGLTGPGYNGHVFWDTDMHMLPFYAQAMPEVARRLIDYRIQTLDAARQNAEAAGLEGAWYAWESAASGEDVTPAYVTGPGGRRMRVLTGEQEIHVVADVAWGIATYVRATGDTELLDAGAADVVLDAARFFASRVVETERGFEIDHVIGPDELHEDVKNSAFTNRMAVFTLGYAGELAEAGHGHQVDDAELARWRDVAARMVILHTAGGLIEQHEGFLSLPVADDAAERPELAWQRDRMQWRDVKQADVVMLMAALEPDYPEAQRRANYRLYEPLTRHLSSLSEAVHSLVAVRAGLATDGEDYRRRAVAIDLRDSRGNCAEGLHLATQGGVWAAYALGFAGLRSEPEGLRVDPRLPEGWSRLSVGCEHRGVPARVSVSPKTIEVACSGGELTVLVDGAEHRTSGGRLLLHRNGDGWDAAG